MSPTPRFLRARDAQGTRPVTLFPVIAIRTTEAEEKKWAGSELNTRHRDFQSLALPTELPARA